jgi:hypothetical protein
MFDKYPSTDQYRNVIREVTDRTQFTGNDPVQGVPTYNRSLPLPTLEFIGRVKLHGTNAGIVFTPREDRKGLVVTAQSRNNVITPENDNAGFARYVKDHEDELIRAVQVFALGMSLPTKNLQSITLFGEWAGKGIQKGVAISELDRKFYIFSIKINDEWVVNALAFNTWDNFAQFCVGSFCTIDHYVSPYYTIIDFSRPEIAQATLVNLTESVEECCPVANAQGVQGIGEGIVWINVDDPKRPLRFKVKGEKHSVSKVKTLADVDVAKIDSAIKFAEYAVTKSRVEQAVQELTGGEPFDIKIMGDVIRWVASDINKEENDVLEKNGLTMKDVGKYTGARTKELFLGML